MKTERIELDGIETGARLRPLNSARVDALVSSISEIGLRTPITVMERRDGLDTRMILVAGNHRLEALRRLGHEFADCIVVSDDDIDAKLWEIDENLIRSPLSPVEEAEHLAKRKELWEARAAARQSEQLVPIESKRTDGKGHRQTAFATETAERLGETKQSINRKIARAVGVSDDAKALIKGTHLDTGAYLDSLMSLPQEQQFAKAERDLTAPRQMPAPTVRDDHSIQLLALKQAWQNASNEVRAEFLAAIGAKYKLEVAA